MSQKKFVIPHYSDTAFTKIPDEKIEAFKKRLSEETKESDREFKRKQKISIDVASKIILNT